MSLFTRLKQFSIKNIVENIFAMIKRFPFGFVNTLLGTGLAVYLIEEDAMRSNVQNLDSETKILLMCALGFPLFLSFTLLAERFSLKKVQSLVFQLFGVGLLVLYFFLLPKELADFQEQEGITLFLLNVIAYLAVFFIPFLKRNNTIGEWKYIETFFLRFFVTGVFAATLFGGLALSLWSVDYLFGVKWDREIYLELWALIVGIFSTWFYLSGFPKQPENLDEGFLYPKVLRVFVQYILVPLLCVFYVILYAYVGKILITRNWPLGGTAMWILVFSIAGVLTYLIGYPMVKEKELAWLKKFFTVFFILIIPLAIVLFMAIGIRIQEYGVTEQRYLVAVFGVWLIVVALYYLLSKKKYIQFVPILTAIVFLVSLFGPWSMFNMSVRSQYSRLEQLLVKNNILVNGKVQPVPEEIKFVPAQASNIRSKIQFLANHGEVNLIQPWFSVNLQKETDYGSGPQKSSSYEVATTALNAMNLENYGEPLGKGGYFSFENRTSQAGVATEGYQYVVPNVLRNSYNKQESLIEIGGRKFNIRVQNKGIDIKEGKDTLVEIDTTKTIEKLFTVYGTNRYEGIAPVDMTVAAENDRVKMKMYFIHLGGQKENEVITLRDVEGVLFVTLK